MSTIREEDMPYDFETLKETKHIRQYHITSKCKQTFY